MSQKVLDMLFRMRADMKELKQVQSELRSTQQQLHKMKTKSGAAFSEMRKGLTMGAGFLGLSGAMGIARNSYQYLYSTGVKFNAMLEQQQVAFETLLGSTEEASERTKEISEIAAKTPFQFGELIQGNKVLQALGGNLLASKEGMILTGNAAAALGRNFEEVAMWVGRLYSGLESGNPVGEATMRLLEMGIISGETKNELEELAGTANGKAKAFDILQKHLGQYSGAMEKQSETFNGIMSTMKDTFTLAMANSYKPFFEEMKKHVRGLLEVMGGVDSASETFVKKMETKVIELRDKVRNVTSDQLDEVQETLKEFYGSILKSINEESQKMEQNGYSEEQSQLISNLIGVKHRMRKLMVDAGVDFTATEIKTLEDRLADARQELKFFRGQERLLQNSNNSQAPRELASLQTEISMTEKGIQNLNDQLQVLYEWRSKIRERVQGNADAQVQVAQKNDKTAQENAAENEKNRIISERDRLLEDIKKNSDSIKQSEFDLLFTYDEQIAALQEKIEALQAQEAEYLKGLENEEEAGQLRLYYATQVAAIEKQIADIKEKKAGEEEEGPGLNGFMRMTSVMSQGIEGLITRTQTLGGFLQNIWSSFLSSAIRAFVLMVHEYGLSKTAMFLVDKVMAAKSLALSAASAAKSLAKWIPSAIAASMSSWGAAAAIGIGAVVAGMAAFGGFAEGGYTGGGGKYQIAGAVHRGEYVIPKEVVSAYGVDYFDEMLKGVHSGSGYSSGGSVTPISPAFAGSQNRGSERKSIILVDDSRSQVIRALQSAEGRKIIQRHVRGARHEF